METLSKEELLSSLTNLISEHANSVVDEVIRDFQLRNQPLDLDKEKRQDVLEQAVSNLTFQSGHFHTQTISDIDSLKNKFDSWFEEDAKKSLVHTITLYLEPDNSKK